MYVYMFILSRSSHVIEKESAFRLSEITSKFRIDDIYVNFKPTSS